MAVVTLMSLFCLVAVPGAFIQALLLVFALYVVCGVAAWCGWLKFAAINLFVLSLAVALSPITDMSVIHGHYALATIGLVVSVFGFGGLVFGIYRLQGKGEFVH